MSIAGALRAAPWLKPFRNAGKLLLGRAAQGVFSLVYTALAARSLGVNDFGTLILVHSFAIAVSQLARFQSWQSLLRYGARDLRDGDIPRFQRSLKFSLLLDGISVVIALAIMLPGAAPAARLFGLPPQSIELARIYGLGVVFINLGSAPGGVLRLLDRFDLLSLQSALEPAVRLMGAIIAFALHATLPVWLVIWFLAMVAGKISLNYTAWRELRRRGLLFGFTWSLRGALNPEPGAWRFAAGTNFSTTLGLATTQVPTLMVGWLAGPAGAGLFKVAQQIASVIVKSNAKLLVPAIYADLAHLTAAGDEEARRRLVVRNGLLAGAAGILLFLIIAIAGKPLIVLLFKKKFLPAYPVLLWLTLAGIVDAALFPLEPLLIASGRIGVTSTVRLVTSLVYAGFLYAFLRQCGLVGAGYAAIGYEIVSGLWLLAVCRRLLMRRPPAAEA